jgi:hypothetical protein
VRLEAILFTNVQRKTTLITDESELYETLGKEFSEHQALNNGAREYVNVAGYATNNVESFLTCSSAVCGGPMRSPANTALAALSLGICIPL